METMNLKDILNYKLVAWGIGQTFFDARAIVDLKYLFFVDSNVKLHGNFLDSVPIVSPQDIFNSIDKLGLDAFRIIIYSPDFSRIKFFLEQQGLVYKREFFYFLDFSEYNLIIEKMSGEKEYLFLEKIIRPGDNGLDVGANIGLYTYKLAKLSRSQGAAQKEGLIIAIEPVKSNFDTLIHHINIFKMSNVLALQVCAKEKIEKKLVIVTPFKNGVPFTGHARLKLTDNDISDSTLFKGSKIEENGEKFDFFEESTTDSVTLDSLISDYNLRSLRYIKIDTEGAEKLVLLGAREILINFKPIVQVELFWNEYEALEVIDYMTKLDYLFFHLGSNGELKEIEENKLKKSEKNYFFIHKLDLILFDRI